MPLPIESVLPALAAALADARAAVLQAPPGAGKTTVVPLALRDAGWLAGQKIIMLEPRRLATRAAASRMASSLGQRVGDTVGYRVRMDTRISRATRIEVVTEGVLTRFLQDDPTLDGVGLVIFDEFHERSLHADIGLALTLHTRALLRPDLRVLVMSATLDGEAVAAILGDADAPAPIVRSEGREFPITTRHIPRRADARLENDVAAAVAQAIRDEAGDILVFLPGAGEIRRVQSLLTERSLGASTTVIPLHGNLTREQQDEAIRASAPGARKVVLATSIAETSLTIEGVRVVVDSGLSRVPRFSPRTGMTRLETIRVSRASADQRRGRAGRVAAGVCYRLWAEHEEGHLVQHAAPEIIEADLAPLTLDLAAAGIDDPLELRWMNSPPAAAYSQARELLSELDALDAAGRITSHGSEMAKLPLHPRLAHMVLRARAVQLASLACDVAALVTERDPLRGDGAPPDPDAYLRLELLRGGAVPAGATADRDALRRIRAEADQLRHSLGLRRSDGPASDEDINHTGVLLALAYPDRIGQARNGQPGHFLMRNGRGAALGPGSSLSPAAFIVAAELDDRRPESRVYLGATLTLADIELHFREQIEIEDVIEWDAASASVKSRRRQQLGALILHDVPLSNPDPEIVANVLVEQVARAGIDRLPWSEAATRLRERVNFLRHIDSAWPDFSGTTLGASAHEWLAPHLAGIRRMDDLARVDLHAVLLGLLDWKQRAALDELAPTHIEVPSGSKIRVDYSDPQSPVLAVRLQEVFGLVDTPRIAGGRVPVTMHLLSPAHRPVQVTQDLAGFWRTSYFDVKREMKGRYPKHRWPDDPMKAEPRRGR